MKRKLCTLALISISFLIFSCSNDEEIVQGNQNNVFKTKDKIDSDAQLSEIKTDTLPVLNLEIMDDDGEPNNPTPK